MPDIPDWLTPFVDAAILIPLLLLVVRITGLRSFAKMSAHDFVVTVAVGSAVAATVLDPGRGWWMGALALVALLGVQWTLGQVRQKSKALQQAMDNEPLVLLRDGVPDREALATARVSEDDLRQKLRQSGCASYADAKLVVMETTGDVSVLTQAPAPDMVAEVRGI